MVAPGKAGGLCEHSDGSQFLYISLCRLLGSCVLLLKHAQDGRRGCKEEPAARRCQRVVKTELLIDSGKVGMYALVALKRYLHLCKWSQKMTAQASQQAVRMGCSAPSGFEVLPKY